MPKMKIKMTSDYENHANIECKLGECFRNYCQQHRLLWRDCETSQGPSEGVFDLGECPRCDKEFRFSELSHMVARSLDKAIDADITHQEHGE